MKRSYLSWACEWGGWYWLFDQEPASSGWGQRPYDGRHKGMRVRPVGPVADHVCRQRDEATVPRESPAQILAQGVFTTLHKALHEKAQIARRKQHALLRVDFRVRSVTALGANERPEKTYPKRRARCRPTVRSWTADCRYHDLGSIVKAALDESVKSCVR